MFDIGMSELLIVGVVSLIVVGPKDLPGMFRTLGRFTAKARSMGREFSRAMDAAADEAGVKDVKDSLNAAANPKQFGLDALKDAADDFEKWDPTADSSDEKTIAKPEMSENRAEMAKMISENAAKKATDRKAREAAAAEKASTNAGNAKPAAKKPAAKKPAAKKPAAKKPAAKKPAATKAKPKAATKKTAAKSAPKSKGDA